MKFIQAHQIAKKTMRNGPVALIVWLATTAWEKRPASWATAATKVRSNRSSRGVAVRCGSPTVRADMGR